MMSHVQSPAEASSSAVGTPQTNSSEALKPTTPSLSQPQPQPQPQPAPSTSAENPAKSSEAVQYGGPSGPSRTPPSLTYKLPPSPHVEKAELVDLHTANPRSPTDQPLPPLPAAYPYDRPPIRRHHTSDTKRSRRSNIDWIVPSIEGDSMYEKSELGTNNYVTRLQATVKAATAKKEEYQKRAKYNRWALNIAIGAQVLLGSLTTGLSAAATTGKSAAIQTTILGGLSTIAASYLAKSRGSGEPELSAGRVKDLEHFLRDCEAFQTDFGHLPPNKELDEKLNGFRRRFEDLLGNIDRQSKSSSPA